MYDGTNFRHFFPSNDSFYPENEGFLAIIGSIFDCGTSAHVGYGDEGKHGKKQAS